MAVTTKDGTFSQRQIEMLTALMKHGYPQVSIGDLVDDDFTDLVSRGFVETYSAIGADIKCHITPSGRDVLKEIR